MSALETDRAAVEEPGGEPQTLCAYLAKQFIFKKGFSLDYVPEAQRLAETCDYLLTYADGHSLIMLCMIDAEANRDRKFGMIVDDVKSIGKACLKYSGRIGLSRMPVVIKIIEVGPSAALRRERLQQFTRFAPFSKVRTSAMTVDPQSSQVWDSTRLNGTYKRFVESILAAPRLSDAELRPPEVVTAPSSFPILTAALLAVLAAIFAAEIAYGIGPQVKPLQPSIATLMALGGLSRTSVLQYGEWYRLLSAPFLHVDIMHLVMNGIGLWISGRILETMVGRWWFAAIYTVSAVCGSLASLMLNPASIISVGASGAIMGLFAAMLVVSRRFPVGPIRSNLQVNAAYTLVPSLLPLTGALSGHQVDYGAHFGGAIGGAVVAFTMLSIWPVSQPWPRFRRAAAALAIAGVIALSYPVIGVLRDYPGIAFSNQLMPDQQLPRTGLPSATQLADMLRRYPRDPRAHLYQATLLASSGDKFGAEREARLGLAEEKLWQRLLPPAVGHTLRATLAAIIADDRRDEAIAIAAPVCALPQNAHLRTLLDMGKLCGT